MISVSSSTFFMISTSDSSCSVISASAGSCFIISTSESCFVRFLNGGSSVFKSVTVCKMQCVPTVFVIYGVSLQYV